MTISLLLLLVAFGCTIAAAMGKCPLWVAVLLVVIERLLAVLPVR
jgi:hypothetical protein